MGLSQLTRPINVSVIARDRPFYGIYQYSLAFDMAQISAMRKQDHDMIDQIIMIRKGFRKYNGESSDVITDQQIQDLHVMCDFLQQAKQPYRLVVSRNRAWLYANCWQFLRTVATCPGTTHVVYSEVKIDRPRDTVVLKTARHARRDYFREQTMTADDQQRLINFFQNQQHHVRLSPSLAKWLQWPHRRIYSYFFVDYDHHSWPVMLNLIHPGIIRKTVQLLQYK